MGTKYDLDQYAKMVDDLKAGYKKAVLEGFVSAGIRLVQVIQTEIIPGTFPQPIDRGIYRAAWQARPLPNGVHVFNKAPHAPMVEYGVRKVVPGPKMIRALAAWVRRKGIGNTAITKKVKGQVVTVVRKVSAKQAESIAWAIAKNAQAKGGMPAIARGRGYRIFQKALRRWPGILTKEVASALSKVRV